MSTPSWRTSTDSASACACAAMDRNPCGPPSQRHHISGESADVRSENGDAGVREPGGAPRGRPSRLAERHRAGGRPRARRRRRPVSPATSPAAEQRAAQRQQRRPAVVRGGVQQHHAALVGVALPGRLNPRIDQGGHRVGHRAQQPPAVARSPVPRRGPPQAPRRSPARRRSRGSRSPARG